MKEKNTGEEPTVFPLKQKDVNKAFCFLVKETRVVVICLN